MSSYSSIKFRARISSTDRNIRDWLLLNCGFIISDVTQYIVLQLLQNFQRNIFGFCVVFSRKIIQISIFKVEYLENDLADFNDFGLILHLTAFQMKSTCFGVAVVKEGLLHNRIEVFFKNFHQKWKNASCGAQFRSFQIK